MAKGWERSLFVCGLGIVGIVASAACSSTGVPSSSDGGATTSCANAPTVEDVSPPTGPQQCAGCSTTSSCTSAEPLQACCTWVAQPHDALSDGINLHRYSTTNANAKPDTSCLATPGTLGTPQMVTLTGFVWLFSSGQDSTGVQVDVYTENTPTTPNGTISATTLGTYVTKSTDAIDPVDTTWNSKCPNGCSYRQYTIPNVPTETPLVIKTSDGGSMQWATLYDYNIYFPNSAVTGGMVSYDATAVAGPDLNTVAGTVGLTIQSGMGLLAGEVHDCSDIRLAGATVETAPGGSTQSHEGPMFYFTTDESNPLPSLQAGDTSDLSLFGALNLQPGVPLRVTAVGQDPASPGQFLMLGTYVVQVYAGAVTAVALRGRRPWQP